MKKSLFMAAPLALILTAAACGGIRNATELGAPKAVEPLSYTESQSMSPVLRDAARAFAEKFSPDAVKGQTGNTAVSPISVYLALGLAAECAAGETRGELLSVLNTDYPTLKSGYSELYRSVIAEYETNTGKNSGRVELSNSIWLQEDVPFKEACIGALSDDYLCWSYAADFLNENRQANDAVRAFIKQQTRGTIDRDFGLNEETVFTIVNTLYLKDLWNMFGDDLPYDGDMHTFTQGNGEKMPARLMQGYYTLGRAYEGETFTHYYAATLHGYRLRFLLPKDGYTAEEVFTEENLALIDGMKDYRPFDEENMLEYHTRCLFPAYTASYDRDVKPILMGYGVEKFFSEACDLTNLTDTAVFCSEVRHVTKLKVDRKGIEGAAVTVIVGAGDAGPGEYTVVEEDFVVDRAFGFVIEKDGAVFFSGIVNEL